MLTEDFLQKWEQFQNGLIDHKAFAFARTSIEECMLKTQYSRESVNCLLLARPGGGKSTLCKLFEKLYPPKIISDGQYEILETPVIFAEMPEIATPKKLASTLLEALGDPNPNAGTEFMLMRRAIKMLSKCKTRLVFIDEFHNLLDSSRTTKAKRDACQALKRLVNQTSCMFCLVGLPEFADAFDSEIERRFMRRYTLPSLTVGDAENPGQLQVFYRSIIKRATEIFGLTSVPPAKDQHFLQQLYVATSGMPGYIVEYIKEAIAENSKFGKTNLDVNDLSSVWEANICREACLIEGNPFTLSPKDLALAVGRSR